MLNKLLQAGKDVLLGQAAKAFLNRLGIQAYGEFEKVEIDTQSTQIHFTLLLKGETQAVDGVIKYHIERSESEVVMVADSAITSREWMNIVFERHFGPEKRRFVVPPQLHKVVEYIS